ncbi:MAG TPA: Uma2 family endonuclease [Polyangiaceae bacterium]
MTVDEWAALDEDVRGELADGVLVEEEMPSVVHEAVVGWLYMVLASWTRARGGFAAPSGVKLAVRANRGRMADVVVWFAGRKPEALGAVRVPPDVVVEVVSPSAGNERRDRVEKPDDYASFGVRWYWLVDPGLRSFEVWELAPGGRHARASAAVDGKVAVPGCDGLELDVDALWAEVERVMQR